MAISDWLRGRYTWLLGSVSRWLPLLVGLVLGSLLALLIANGAVVPAVLLVFAAPALMALIRYPFAAVLIWLLLMPFFLSPSVTGAFTLHWLLHRCLVPGMLAFVLVGGWLGTVTRSPLRLGPAEWAMFGFGVWVLVSIWLWNEDPLRSAVNVYDRIFVPFCAYLLTRLTLNDKKDVENLLWVALFTLVVQITVSLISWFAPQLLPSAYRFGAWRGGRTVGTLRSPGVYSSTVAFLALLLYHYALTCRVRWRRRLLVALFVLATFAIFMSFSRSSWVGLAAVLTGLLLFYPKTTGRLVLIFLLLAVVLGTSLLSDELAWAYERLTSDLAQLSIGGRVIVGNAMLRMIGERPLFGWGYNRYRFYLGQYKVPVGSISVVGQWNNPSHNSYLTIMTELGVPAVLIYLFPAAWWLWRNLRARYRMADQGFWSWRLVAVLWLSMLHMFIEGNFADIISYQPFGTTLWWMALGLISAFVGQHTWSEQSESTEPLGA